MQFKLSFAHKVIGAAALLLILSLSVSTFSNYLSLKQSTEQNLNNAIDEIGNSVAGNIANWLTGKLDIVLAMSANLTEHASSKAIQSSTQQAAVSGHFKNAYIAIEKSGEFILDDPSINLPDDFDARQRPWYTLAKKTLQPSFTEIYIDATLNQPILSAIAPVERNGKFLGVAGGDIFLEDITGILNQIDFLDMGYAYLMTAEGDILSHPDKSFNSKNIVDLLGQKPPLSIALNQIDEQHIVSFIPVKGIASVNWYVGVVLDIDKAYSEIANAKTNAIIFGALSVLITVLILHFLMGYLMRPIHHLNRAVSDISQGEGDLTQRLAIESQDEIGLLSENFNEFIDTVHQSMRQVSEMTHLLAGQIDQVKQSTQSGLSMADEQANRGSSVSVAVNELNSASQEISTNASNASQLTTSIHQQSNNGIDALAENISSIEQLSVIMEGSSDEIGKLSDETQKIVNILDVIKGVSAQTNLLALNAAIEAARAGDAGRGFAVVADEVRQLAQRTQDAAAEIDTLVENLQSGTRAVVSSMAKSQESSHLSVEKAAIADDKMRFIIGSLEKVDDENQSVSLATQQQVTVIQSIDEDIIQLMELSEQGRLSLNQTEQACDALQQEYTKLSQLVDRFKV